MFPALSVGICVELLPLEAHPISPTRGSEAGTWGLSSTHQQLLGPVTSTLILSPASCLHQSPAEGGGEIQGWACDTPHQRQLGGAQGAHWHSLSTHYLPGTCAESSRDPMSLTKLLWRLDPHSQQPNPEPALLTPWPSCLRGSYPMPRPSHGSVLPVGSQRISPVTPGASHDYITISQMKKLKRQEVKTLPKDAQHLLRVYHTPAPGLGTSSHHLSLCSNTLLHSCGQDAK